MGLENKIETFIYWGPWKNDISSAFCQKKFPGFDSIFTEFCSQCFILWIVNIAVRGGFAPKRWQIITWTNYALSKWCINASPDLSELNGCYLRKKLKIISNHSWWLMAKSYNYHGKMYFCACLSWVQSGGPVTTESIVRFDTWFQLFEVFRKK